MAFHDQIVDIDLTAVSWDELLQIGGGGGFGGAPGVRPFIWVAFFLADGTTLMLDDSASIAGQAQIFPSLNSHGTLGWDDLHPGHMVGIPDAVGHWTSMVKPIPVAPGIQPFFGAPDIPATFGAVVVVLVDGGHIPKHAIEAGHAKFNESVTNALAALLAKLGPDHQMITAQDIADVTDGLKDDIGNAVLDALSTLEKIWAISGQDYLIGYRTFNWDQSDLIAAKGHIDLNDLPDNGDPTHEDASIKPMPDHWSLRGSVSLFDPCPAEAVAAVIDGFAHAGGSKGAGNPPPKGSGRSGPLGAMRRFRDAGGLNDHPGLSRWWRAGAEQLPAILSLLRRSPEARRAASAVMAQLETVLAERAAPLPADFQQALHSGIMAAERDGAPRLRTFARDVGAILSTREPLSAHELLAALAERRPR